MAAIQTAVFVSYIVTVLPAMFRLKILDKVLNSSFKINRINRMSIIISTFTVNIPSSQLNNLQQFFLKEQIQP
jgi:hypothetical protein